MRKLAALLLLAITGVTACNRVPTDDHRGPSMAPAKTAGHATSATAAATPFGRRSPIAFASLPDRGDLAAYPSPSPARRDGAYTWHRAQLSEAHALQSVVSGRMRFTTPAGVAVDFDYVRHVEHPSGDWTWVGRVAGGAEWDQAVVTFGEKATFGSIAQPGGTPLRVTTRNGAAWIVETDLSQIAGIDNPATRPTRPDYLEPPANAALPVEAAAPTTATAVPIAASATAAAAGTTVDVVLGYTNGFASSLGGASQAVTRLNNMVETANQAYANSQVDARLRLVHSLQVDYPDNTDNGDALEKLTGYKSGTGWIASDPAFNALRAARDQYGGDLVSLVRKFTTPENSGCGIAWLLGGGQTVIDGNDAPFGYSVVSDGTDPGTDGKTYFCREETLAHELGHNMGSQHDRATSTENGVLKYGVYPYSLGYKTAVGGGNFYTVMAYGDSGQVPFRIFSNPRTTFCGGNACGVTDQADNARSLSQTMPIVAGFRATVVPLEPVQLANTVDAKDFDVDADGRSDLLWDYPSSNQWAYWLMSGATKVGGVGYTTGAGWRILATGDFTGDRRVDLVWTNGTDMQMWISQSAGGFVGVSMSNYPSGWRVVAVGDFNGDGRSDLAWRSLDNANLALWWMQGATITRGVGFSTSPQWSILASGDLGGDGRADLIWVSGSSMQLWSSVDGASFAGLVMPSYPTGWTLVGIGDFAADGRDDLFWRHGETGQLAYWQMSGASRISGIGFSASPAWSPFQVADFTGDGRVDIAWTDGVSSQLWVSNGSGVSGVPMPNYPTGWGSVRR